MGADGFLLYNEKRVDLKSVKAHTQNTSNLQLKLNNLSALFFFPSSKMHEKDSFPTLLLK